MQIDSLLTPHLQTKVLLSTVLRIGLQHKVIEKVSSFTQILEKPFQDRYILLDKNLPVYYLGMFTKFSFTHGNLFDTSRAQLHLFQVFSYREIAL